MESNYLKNPYHSYFDTEKPTPKDIRKLVSPYFMTSDIRPALYKSFGLLAISKIFTLASPYCMKIAVNAMSEVSKLDPHTAMLAILAFGITRALSVVTHEMRMYYIVDIIQGGIKNVSAAAFLHLHALDLTFHKLSTKNTVFSINRAIRSIETGMRFAIGFFMPVFAEFIVLSGALYFYCGPLYLLNMMATLTLYTTFSKRYSVMRQQLIRTRKN